MLSSDSQTELYRNFENPRLLLGWDASDALPCGDVARRLFEGTRHGTDATEYVEEG